MKVLEKGRDQTGWSIEQRCTGYGNGEGGCGAKLLVEIGDIFLTHSYHRDEHDTYCTFQCCECQVLTDLHPSNEPPYALKKKLPNRK